MKTVSKLKTAILYAEAMYDGAKKAGDLDMLYADTQGLEMASAEDIKQLSAINNPLITASDRVETVELLAAKLRLSQSMLNTLKLLAENRKLDLLALICRQFTQLYQQKHDIAAIEVTTVTPLTAAQENKLKTKLKNIFKKEILINYIIDPQIIGGLIIRCGTNFIDNSIKHKLNALEQLMKGTK